jgi:hypothetical protein
MLRICLFGRSKRRKQPERYMPFFLKFMGNNGKGGIHAAKKNVSEVNYGKYVKMG